MGDWIGLGVIVLVVLGAFFGLARLGAPPEPLTKEEFERRAAEGRGLMSAGMMAGMHALQKLLNPKAAEAVEVERDLKAGYYDDQQEKGDGDDPETAEDFADAEVARERADEPRESFESVKERLRTQGELDD
jgi:hypothetical protein